MPFLAARRDRAALLTTALGIGVLVAVWPYLTALVAAPVLYIVFGRLHRRLAGRIGASASALVVILLAFLLILLPLAGVITMLAAESETWIATLRDSELLRRLAEVRIGSFAVGTQLQDLGSSALGWLGANVLRFVGSGAKLLVQFTIAFFGLYYVLLDPAPGRALLESFIPFSAANRERLLQRFTGVTISMLLGTFATSVIQGTIVGAGFALTGLPSPTFWGVVCVILAILPVVGSGLVWAPAAAFLALVQHRPGAAVLLVALGLLAGNVDNLVRPFIYRRYAQIHPFISVIGAFAGVPVFGLLGLLIGPLAISYFFELVRMYREEYLLEDGGSVGGPGLAADTEDAPSLP